MLYHAWAAPRKPKPTHQSTVCQLCPLLQLPQCSTNPLFGTEGVGCRRAFPCGMCEVVQWPKLVLQYKPNWSCRRQT
eukprot:2775364-Amphidinium_carterae.2